MDDTNKDKIFRTICIFDPMSADDETQNALDQLKFSGINTELVAEGMGVHELNSRDGIDLVVFDYGGMSIMGARDTSLAQTRAMYEWAENHPSSLVLIWSAYTADLYEEVTEEIKATELANVIFMDKRGVSESAMPQVRQFLQVERSDGVV